MLMNEMSSWRFPARRAELHVDYAVYVRKLQAKAILHVGDPIEWPRMDCEGAENRGRYRQAD